MIPFNMRNFATASLCLAGLAAGAAQAQMLTPVWTELGDHGTVARVIVNAPADCPTVTVDGTAMKMAERLPVPDGLRPACELQIPATATSATVGTTHLALPKSDPSRVVVIGDTGCR